MKIRKHLENAWGIIQLALIVFGGFAITMNGCTPASDRDEINYITNSEQELVEVEKFTNDIELNNLYRFKEDYGDAFYGLLHSFESKGMCYILVEYNEGLVIINTTKDSLMVENLKKNLIDEGNLYGNTGEER